MEIHVVASGTMASIALSSSIQFVKPTRNINVFCLHGRPNFTTATRRNFHSALSLYDVGARDFTTCCCRDETSTDYFTTLTQWNEQLCPADSIKGTNTSTGTKSLLILRGGEVNSRIVNQSNFDEEIKLSPETQQSSDVDKIPSRNERISWSSLNPKRLWTAAKNVIGRATGILRLNQSSSHHENQLDNNNDPAFAELDSILEQSSANEEQQEEEDGQPLDGSEWLDSETSPPKGALLLKGWRQRSLRVWINKMENKFLSNETALALKTIKKILESFPEYGVVDLFGMYSPKDVILSVVALSRLQHIMSNQRIAEAENSDADSSIDIETLEDLAHYAKFAHAAYGWKGLAAFCGRLHLGGDSRALMKRTGIDRRDIIMTNWHSRANRPAFFLIRDVKKKTLVLSIRGTLSPRDILTDLCASCENFFVEDKSDSDEIGVIEVGRAHKGMVHAAKSVARMTGKVITDELQSSSDYSLVIVGHSLGGGVAATLTTLWRRRFEGKIRCIGYGMPCVFPTNDGQDQIISLIGQGDPFSVISLGHVADITQALSKLCQDKGLRDQILHHTHFGKLTSLNDLPQIDLDFSTNAMNFLRKQMNAEKLYPPGTIFLMAGSLFNFNIERLNSSQERTDTNIRRVDTTHFDELKLHARMFDLSYHLPARYEAVLERILSSSMSKS